MKAMERAYRSALDRLKVCEDAYGRTIWVEGRDVNGKPVVYYRYDSNGRLVRHERGLYGYVITPADYTRFGEACQVENGKLRTENGKLF